MKIRDNFKINFQLNCALSYRLPGFCCNSIESFDFLLYYYYMMKKKSKNCFADRIKSSPIDVARSRIEVGKNVTSMLTKLLASSLLCFHIKVFIKSEANSVYSSWILYILSKANDKRRRRREICVNELSADLIWIFTSVSAFRKLQIGKSHHNWSESQLSPQISRHHTSLIHDQINLSNLDTQVKKEFSITESMIFTQPPITSYNSWLQFLLPFTFSLCV